MKKKLEFEGILYEFCMEDGGLLIGGKDVSKVSKSILYPVRDAIRDMVGGRGAGIE